MDYQYHLEVHQSRNLFCSGKKLEADKLPLFAEIDKIVREGQVIAEQRFLSNPANKAAAYSIQMQRAATNAMKRGDVDKASQIQKKELETRQLLQMPNK